jgi:hypothetical protein
MDRATFDKLAAYWTIRLQSSNERVMEKGTPTTVKIPPVGQTQRNSMFD